MNPEEIRLLQAILTFVDSRPKPLGIRSRAVQVFTGTPVRRKPLDRPVLAGLRTGLQFAPAQDVGRYADRRQSILGIVLPAPRSGNPQQVKVWAIADEPGQMSLLFTLTTLTLLRTRDGFRVTSMQTELWDAFVGLFVGDLAKPVVTLPEYPHSAVWAEPSALTITSQNTRQKSIDVQRVPLNGGPVRTTASLPYPEDGLHSLLSPTAKNVVLFSKTRRDGNSLADRWQFYSVAGELLWDLTRSIDAFIGTGCWITDSQWLQLESNTPNAVYAVYDLPTKRVAAQVPAKSATNSVYPAYVSPEWRVLTYGSDFETGDMAQADHRKEALSLVPVRYPFSNEKDTPRCVGFAASSVNNLCAWAFRSETTADFVQAFDIWIGKLDAPAAKWVGRIILPNPQFDVYLIFPVPEMWLLWSPDGKRLGFIWPGWDSTSFWTFQNIP